jgi:putative ABC transport system substrate-binding protein
MRRPEFIKVIAVSAAWPLIARAPQPTMPVIGFLSTSSADASRIAAFRQGLAQAGYVEGQNVTIEYGWGEDRSERLPSLAADLVYRQVAVIAAPTTPAALAAKAATTTIPIVFTTIGDPVQLHVVTSLSRPGGNVTGVTQTNVEMMPKRLQLLHELVPTASVMALLVNPTNPFLETETKELQAAARSLGVELHVLNASTERDFDGVFAKLVQLQAGGLVSCRRCIIQHLDRTARRAGAPPRGANDLPKSQVCLGRRSAELRNGLYGDIPPSRYLYRPGSQGRQACRPTGPAGHESRAVHQPQDS